MKKRARNSAKSAVRTPVQGRSRATREALLKATAQLLGQRGYAPCTTNDIAKRAGVSIGSLYEYFANKDAIVHALVDEHLTAAEQLFSTRASELMKDASTRPLRSVLGAMVETMLSFHADDPKVHRVLSSEATRSRAARARVLALEAGVVTLLTSLLAAHPEAKLRRPALAARVIVETVDALTHRWILEPSGEPISVSRLSDELTHMLTAYVTR
jgi:AcrR family transcriptional regulator